MNSKESFYIMELQISDIISLTLKKARINGLSSMMKESENTIQETFSLTVLVERIGEDNHRVHIFSFMKKSKRDQLSLNLKPKKIKNQR